MKTLLATLLLCAATAPAVAGPDFISTTPHGKLAASDAHRQMLPTDDIEFTEDSSALLEAAQAQLRSVAQWMRNNKRPILVLAGHTNSAGPADHNAELAMRRSVVVRDALMKLGVPADRMMIVVYGETGADQVPSSTDRRVVMYASNRRPQQIAAAEIRHGQALSALWTHQGVLFTEIHGVRPREVVATR